MSTRNPLISETDVCLSSHLSSEDLDDLIKSGKFNVYATEDGERFFEVEQIRKLLKEDEINHNNSDESEDDYFNDSDFEI